MNNVTFSPDTCAAGSRHPRRPSRGHPSDHVQPDGRFEDVPLRRLQRWLDQRLRTHPQRRFSLRSRLVRRGPHNVQGPPLRSFFPLRRPVRPRLGVRWHGKFPPFSNFTRITCLDCVYDDGRFDSTGVETTTHCWQSPSPTFRNIESEIRYFVLG